MTVTYQYSEHVKQIIFSAGVVIPQSGLPLFFVVVEWSLEPGFGGCVIGVWIIVFVHIFY